MGDLFYNPAQLKKLIPPAHSASDWTDKELLYYNVGLVIQNMEKMFGDKALTDDFLSEKARKFLNSHSQDYYNKFQLSYWLNPNREEKDFDELSWLIYSYKDSKNIVATVDGVIFFLLKLCFARNYLIKPRLPFQLTVCNMSKEAIPDFTLVSQCNFKGLIIVVDKTEESKDNAYAQMIAEGIAVAQQKDWNCDWPIYMILCRGLDIEIYKAFFGKTFLDNARKGYDCGEKTLIYKLNHVLDLMNELRLIMRIFHALYEFKDRK